MKKIILLALSIVAAVSTFSFVKQIVDNDQAKNLVAEDKVPQVMCYETSAPTIVEPTIEELKKQLANLERLFKEKKIDKTAYEIRKKDLLDQIKHHQ